MRADDCELARDFLHASVVEVTGIRSLNGYVQLAIRRFRFTERDRTDENLAFQLRWRLQLELANRLLPHVDLLREFLPAESRPRIRSERDPHIERGRAAVDQVNRALSSCVDLQVAILHRRTSRRSRSDEQ